MSKDKKLQTFGEELENDTLQTAQVIAREERESTSSEGKHAIEVFKRVLTLIDKGGGGVSAMVAVW